MQKTYWQRLKRGREQYGDLSMSYKLLDKVVDGKVMVDQGVVAGCSGGTYENVCAVTDIVKGRSVGASGFNFSVYPASQPLYFELVNNGYIPELMLSGAVIRSAFCGPCFGAGDVPAHNGLSIRHTTRNFPNREGSKPSEGQISWVALMDARSIAATAANGGVLTPATDVCSEEKEYEYRFNKTVYGTGYTMALERPCLIMNLDLVQILLTGQICRSLARIFYLRLPRL